MNKIGIIPPSEDENRIEMFKLLRINKTFFTSEMSKRNASTLFVEDGFDSKEEAKETSISELDEMDRDAPPIKKKDITDDDIKNDMERVKTTLMIYLKQSKIENKDVEIKVEIAAKGEKFRIYIANVTLLVFNTKILLASRTIETYCRRCLRIEGISLKAMTWRISPFAEMPKKDEILYLLEKDGESKKTEKNGKLPDKKESNHRIFMEDNFDTLNRSQAFKETQPFDFQKTQPFSSHTISKKW